MNFGESPSDTHSRSDSTIHYCVTALLQPTTIATRKKSDRRREERRKTVSEGWDLISTIEGSKSRGGDIPPHIFSLLHPLVQSRTCTLRRTASSQTEVTDINCSDHSTTSKEMAAWWALMSIPSDTDSGSDSTIRSSRVVWAVKIDDFCLARCCSPQGSNPALHWAAGVKENLFGKLFPAWIHV